MQHAHEPALVLGVLKLAQLVLQRGRDPLDRMAEQMEEEETLHLEPDVGVDHDAESVEDAGPGRIQIAIFDDEPVLHDARSHLGPEAHHLAARQMTDETGAMELMARKAISLSVQGGIIAPPGAPGLR